MTTDFRLIEDTLELEESFALGSIYALIDIEVIKGIILTLKDDWFHNRIVAIPIATNLTLKDLKQLRDRIDYIISCDTLLD